MDHAYDDRLRDAWRDHHAHLVSMAFGMLGDVGAAEDATQEAFVRLAAVDQDSIRDLRGWLTVVTGRRCLDHLQSAHSRRESAYEEPLLDNVGHPLSRETPADPADRITLDDEVSAALLVLLQRLTPPERVVYLLHDVFDVPFDEIAMSVGRSTAACRQLASRARNRLRSGRARTSVDVAEHRRIAESFISACSRGDMDELVSLLDPDAWGTVDLGPDNPITGRVTRGAEQVARGALRHLGSGTTCVLAPSTRRPVLMAFVDRILYSVVMLNIEDEHIRSLEVIGDPQRLAVVAAHLAR